MADTLTGRMQGIKNPWRQCVRAALATLLPRSMFLCRESSWTEALYLTFDDGPHPEHTPRVLDVLAEAGAKATFFVIGREAEKYPDIVQRIAQEGHTVGDHSWSHADVRTLSSRAFGEELTRSRNLLQALSGTVPRLFRPPCGKVGPRQFATLLRRHYAVVLWNFDVRDYSCQSSEEVQRRLAQQRVKAGDIVLLHDDLHFTPESVKSIITQTKSRLSHLTFKAL